jgi:GntR family transcriptional regulator, rspAB operon transcriptional repressor
MAANALFRTMREQIADHIRTDVLTGELEAGERLREQDLAARYGVSRGPVRDALLQLTKEGLLVAKPNCGVTVSHPPSEELQPLIVELRRRIEGFAIGRAVASFGEDDIEHLAKHVEGLGAACRKEDLAGVVQHDMAFHRLLVESSGMDAVELWLPIVMRMWLHYGRHEDLMESYREHAMILQAVRDRDLVAATAALERNIQ